MANPVSPIDEHADLDPSHLAAMNPDSHEEPPAKPASPAISSHNGAPTSADKHEPAAGPAGETIPVAPHPTTNKFPWASVDNPKSGAPQAPEAPKLPPAKPKPALPDPKPAPPPPAPDPIPDTIAVDAPAQAGPVALAPIVAYDADLDKHVTAKVGPPKPQAEQVQPGSKPVQQQTPALETQPMKVKAPEPPPPPREVKPIKPKTVNRAQPIKLYSNETRHVWRAQRFQRQYKIYVLVFMLMIIAVLVFAWMALGSPTSLESLNILNT